MEEQPLNLRSGYYRISAKALILDETRTKFLIAKEDNGKWELPGGGLDWGEKPQEGIVREIKEEMGLTVTYVAKNPSYFTVMQRDTDGCWVANIIYETAVENLEFTPSEECVELRFVSPHEASILDLFGSVRELLPLFNSINHQ
ncbi:MAG: hypothetical protein RLZZ70_63 [Candidatus Parcubacteria bacterium]|jgi:ADP-ribose pyrophosphatase YjhB (NUDIX family)